MNKDNYIREGHCYVLLQTKEIHPISFRRFDFVWYPERAKTLVDLHKALPYKKSIVTESAHIIALYSAKNVSVWDIEEDRWETPDMQTYGASRTLIDSNFLGIRHTIPARVADGGEAYGLYVKKVEESYERVRLKYENPVECGVLETLKK